MSKEPCASAQGLPHRALKTKANFKSPYGKRNPFLPVLPHGVQGVFHEKWSLNDQVLKLPAAELRGVPSLCIFTLSNGISHFRHLPPLLATPLPGQPSFPDLPLSSIYPYPDPFFLAAPNPA